MDIGLLCLHFNSQCGMFIIGAYLILVKAYIGHNRFNRNNVCDDARCLLDFAMVMADFGGKQQRGSFAHQSSATSISTHTACIQRELFRAHRT